MKLDKPTLTALAVFLSGTLAVVGAELAGKLTFAAAVGAEQPLVMALLIALGIVSHGTPSESDAKTGDKPADKPADPGGAP